MLFNSNFFIYIFLPSMFIIYFSIRCICFRKYAIRLSNIVLLLFSLLFYFFTGGKSILVLLFVIVFNYLCALSIERFCRYRTFLFIFGVAVDIGVLLFYKYSYFLYSNVAKLFRFTSEHANKLAEIVLPVGISFFLFQALSYLIDVYRGEVLAQRNLGKFALYISLFPQLVAGPIVRYKTICEEIDCRRVELNDVYEGACRFAFGLGKKVLIADLLGTVVDAVWALPTENISTMLAWSVAFLYTLQIYYDFSGYSDMAIGLGRIFGFHFLENFTLPYTSHNLTEFWKKWHISLSSFLKDYLYIPLGGNRMGILRTYRNLFIVFFICGLWHGAAWNFVIWGIYHGLFLIVERILYNKFSFRMKGIIGQALCFFFVLMGWVLFRAGSISGALDFLQIMFGGQSGNANTVFRYGYYVYPKIMAVSLFAFTASFLPFRRARYFVNQHNLKGILAVAVLAVSMVYISDASFTPFIYFQF